MLKIHEKRTVHRLIGENKVVKIKQSPLEVLASPIGVHARDLQECQTVLLQHCYEKIEEMTLKIGALDELLGKLLLISKGENPGGTTDQ